MRVLFLGLLITLSAISTAPDGDLIRQTLTITAAQPAPYRIAFSSDRDTGDHWQLYTMDADGANITRLLTSDANDFGAQLSPDATQLLFTRRTAQGYSEVHLLDVGASESRLVVPGSLPSWSPDGTTIAYTSIEEGNAEIYLIDPNGFNRRPLTDHPGRDYAASWSPDGEFIAFKSNRDSDTALYVIRPDGTELRRLVTADVTAHAPSWSQDGAQLLYTRESDGTLHIYVVDVATGETRRPFESDMPAQAPVWTPDGDGVIFVSIIDSQPDVFRAPLDGSQPVRLTTDDAWDWYPTLYPR